MIENPETGALENFNFDQLLQHVPELKRFNYRISSYQFDPPIDSSDMEPSLWAKIVKIINYNYDNFDGFGPGCLLSADSGRTCGGRTSYLQYLFSLSGRI